MLKTVEILEKVAEIAGSKNKAADALGMSRQSFYGLIKNGWVLQDPQLLKAAELLDIDPEFLILSAAVERNQHLPCFKELAAIANKYAPAKKARKRTAKAAAVLGFLATGFAAIAPSVTTLPIA